TLTKPHPSSPLGHRAFDGQKGCTSPPESTPVPTSKPAEKTLSISSVVCRPFRLTRRWSKGDSNRWSLSRGYRLILAEEKGPAVRSGWSRKPPSLFTEEPAVRNPSLRQANTRV